MEIEIEVVNGEFVVMVATINLVARFMVTDADIMSKFIQSLVLNVKSY